MPRKRKGGEWIGKTDDAMPSTQVRQRIFEREKATCYLCNGIIDAGQGFHLDHREELADGGENRESNLYPVHAKCHRRKTAENAAERAIVKRKAAKHTGAKRPKGTLKSRGFATVEKQRKIDKSALPDLPPPRLFQGRNA